MVVTFQLRFELESPSDVTHHSFCFHENQSRAADIILTRLLFVCAIGEPGRRLFTTTISRSKHCEVGSKTGRQSSKVDDTHSIQSVDWLYCLQSLSSAVRRRH